MSCALGNTSSLSSSFPSPQLHNTQHNKQHNIQQRLEDGRWVKGIYEVGRYVDIVGQFERGWERNVVCF